ncbi:MAG: hypothetical protein D6782_06440, partial [Alphaproteobacteria bacterium]
MLLRRPKLGVISPQGRAAIAGNEACRILARAGVAGVLLDRQAHQCLCAGQEHAAAFSQIFIRERNHARDYRLRPWPAPESAVRLDGAADFCKQVLFAILMCSGAQMLRSVPPISAAPVSPSRRRVLRLLAATSASGLAMLCGATADGALSPPAPVRWTGRALGATASIVAYHPDPAASAAAIAGVRAEIGRLEGIFSLYRRDSLLARLNGAGRLADVPAEMAAVLDICDGVHDASDGAFDPT